MFTDKAFWRGVALCGGATAALLAGEAQAAAASFNVAAQPAATGLTEFARQAGIQILAPATATAGKRTAAVVGALSVGQALQRLLDGAGLIVVSNDGHTVTLAREQAPLVRARYDVAMPFLAAATRPSTAIADPVVEVQEEIEAVVITGSRLQPTGFTAPTPVTVIGSAEVEQKGGALISEFVKDIPAFRSPVGQSQNSNGAQSAGKATLALRGLGASRTLTLVNGRRHVPDGTGNVFDSNLIPTSMVDRVDVVTGGASAAYGSDAVAGVVNLILKNRYEGFQVDLGYGVSQRGDAIEYNPAFIAGGAFFGGRLHVVVGGDYVKSLGTGTMYAREWGRKEPGVMSIAATVNGVSRVTLGLPANLIANYIETSAYNDQGMITSGPLKGTVFHDGGLTSTFDYGVINGGTEMYNPRQTNYGSVENPDGFLRAPYQRHAYVARAEFDFTDDIVGFAQLQFAEFLPKGRSFGARIPNFSNYPVLITNPFIPASVRAAMIANNITSFNYSATRHADLGSIKSRNRTDTFQYDAGLKGKVFGDWDWDIGAGYGIANFDPKLIDTPRTADFFQSAYVVSGPNGNPVCGPVATNPYFNAQNALTKQLLLDTLSPGCVPYNIFGANIDYNQAAERYWNSASNADFEFKLFDVTANLAGTLPGLPAGPISFATGLEYRKDKLRSRNSYDGQRNALMNQNYSYFAGQSTVKEGYVEIGAPLVRDAPLIKALDLSVAARRTDYSVSGAVTTWKAGFTWDVSDMLRLRGTRSRDIRAPNINELFNPGSEGNPNVQNRVTGASAFIKNNTVGNAALKPEIGDTTTIGVVFQPSWAWTKGLRVAVDWYDIRLKGAIATIGAQEILDDLLLRGNTAYEQFVTRDPSNPTGFSRVNSTQLNLNAQRTNGVDIEVAYRVPTLPLNIPGQLNLRAIGGWVDDNLTITASGVNTDTAGTITNPEWSWNATATYMLGRLTANLQVRYVDKVKYSATLIGPDDPNYSVSLGNSINKNLWPEALYYALSGSYVLKEEGKRRLQVYGNIDNLLDKKPPIVAISSQGAYDLIGRAFKVGVRYSY